MFKTITIVGGGTAGLISALILKERFSKINIQVIKSDSVGIIGVGEGTTEHFKEFMDFVGIGVKDLVKKTDATLKHGVYFKDWTKNNYYHNVLGPFYNFKFGQTLTAYSHITVKDFPYDKYTVHQGLKHDKVSKEVLPNQYHFNTNKLNKFLIDFCKRKNIKIIDDVIDEVKVRGKKIQYIKGKKKYKSDFYIDCTGFKRLLISKLGAKWASYKENLPLNEAIAFQTPDTKDYPSYTLARAMKAGWLWRIPTQGRWGNGYVFDNRYINAKEAKKECEQYLKTKIKIAKNIKFEPGALDKPWIGNCAAIGLSSSFFEPLEASSIGLTIQQNFLLMHYLIHSSEEDIKYYNEKFTSMVENIRDFIILHYCCGKKNSKFWKELNFKIPESLIINLKKWKNRLPIKEDFSGDFHVFNAPNFAVILKELGLCDLENLKNEYESLNPALIAATENHVTSLYNFWKNHVQLINHKKYLKNIDKYINE